MRLLLDRFAGLLVRSLFAAIPVAVAAALSGAPVATAASIGIQGSSFPGINTYSIVLFVTTEDQVVFYSTGVTTTVPNGYTGIFTHTPPAAFTPLPINDPPTDLGTGFAGSWAGQSSIPMPGGTYTIGTFQLDLTRDPYYPGPGCQVPPHPFPGCFVHSISPFIRSEDGVRSADGTSVLYATSGMGFVGTTPEPSTAALLGLGLRGLAASRRRQMVE